MAGATRGGDDRSASQRHPWRHGSSPARRPDRRLLVVVMCRALFLTSSINHSAERMDIIFGRIVPRRGSSRARRLTRIPAHGGKIKCWLKRAGEGRKPACDRGWRWEKRGKNRSWSTTTDRTGDVRCFKYNPEPVGFTSVAVSLPRTRFSSFWMVWHQHTSPNYAPQLHRTDRAVVCGRHIVIG